MKELMVILNLICCISVSVILVDIAIMIFLLMCKAIIEVIDDWRYEHANMRSRRRLSSLDDERSNQG